MYGGLLLGEATAALGLGFVRRLCRLRLHHRDVSFAFGFNFDFAPGFRFEFHLGIRAKIEFGVVLYRNTLARRHLLQHLVEQRRFARIHLGRRRLLIAEIMIAMASAAADLGW